MDKVVILAAGLGTRMRKANSEAGLTDAQAEAAQSGVKALIPIDRPFLDYVLSRLADAGYRKVCMVTGPKHNQLRDYYKSLQSKRLKFEFAIQQEPLGTSDAVLAAEKFAGDDEFVVINSDNHYPANALRQLRQIQGCALVGFESGAMTAASNIEPERIKGFAVAEVNGDGYLSRIVEKPDEKFLAAAAKPIYLSMNCWRLNSSIFTACRNIKPSARGELELPDAVEYAMEKLGQQFRLIRSDEAVLDLSSREDVGPVAEILADEEVSL